MTEIEVLRKSIRRWKTIAIVSWVGIASTIVLCIVVAGYATAAGIRQQHMAMEAERATRQAMQDKLQRLEDGK